MASDLGSTGLYFTLALGGTAVLTAGLCKWVISQAKKWKIIDDPKTHQLPKVVHTQAVPRGGGIAIGIAVLIGIGILMAAGSKLAGVAIGVAILLGTGWWDDRHEEKFSPFVRLILNLAAALAVVGSGVGINYISNPLGGIINLGGPTWCLGNSCMSVAGIIISIGWLVWMQNIVGWSSGVDGQLPGFVITAALVMAALGTRDLSHANDAAVLLAGITAGAYVGFLPFNWWPQKMMPGYGGKSLAGFLLGVLAILSTAKVGAMLMVLGLPMIDGVMVIIKRIREGRLPVWGGREHVHHYLLDRGWSKPKIAGFYWGISIFLGIGAWRLQAPAKFYTIAAITLVGAGLILWLQLWSTSLKQPGPGSG